jgi:hypothetical protein
MGQELVEHFLGGDQRRLAERAHGSDHFGVPLVFAIGDGDPIDRIGKYPRHGDDGRLGNP